MDESQISHSPPFRRQILLLFSPESAPRFISEFPVCETGSSGDRGPPVAETEFALWSKASLETGSQESGETLCSLLLVSLRSLSKGLALPVACTPRDGSRSIDSLQASSVSGTWLLFILVNKSYCQIFNVHTQWPVCVCECVLNNEFLHVSSHIPQI